MLWANAHKMPVVTPLPDSNSEPPSLLLDWQAFSALDTESHL